ncbi:ornithine aminotransferase, mitochondrial-like isoform X2 [Lycorma delicatula]
MSIIQKCVADMLLKNFVTGITNSVGTRTISITLSRNISSKEVIQNEKKYHANNYEPVPIVISRGQGVHVWDVEGKQYLDFLGGFATLNQGHCNPKILKMLFEQASKLHHTSRSHYNDVLWEFSEFITKLIGFDKVLAMNTGVEGGETAVKLARRWGYMKKKIPENEAIVLFARGNFWGRTMAAISSSVDRHMYENFGPFMPNFNLVPYNDLKALEEALKNPNVCAFMVEPLQGEAGVVVPDDGYLKGVRELCTKYNVLWIDDEVQAGLGRTGKLRCCDYEKVKPDVIILGKALAGGLYPVSAILADDSVMDCFTPGTHGSTFGGNPLGCKVAITAVKVITDEGLIENSYKMGVRFRSELEKLLPKDRVFLVRGKGLLNAIALNEDFSSPWDFCVKLRDNGMVTRPCKDNIIRFAPPLIITEPQLNQGIEIIVNTVKSL